MIFFWIAVAILSAAVTLAVTRPLMRSTEAAPPETADAAVYKDQLAEIDAEYARGMLTVEDAEAARAEVARRLIRAAGEGNVSAASKGAVSNAASHIAKAALAAIPVLSLALYLSVGEPSMPGQPLDARLAKSPEQSGVSDLVAKVEARLRDHPEDGQGWDAIAPVYASLGRYEESANAYASAMRILGETPKRLEGFAMSRIRAGSGLVDETSRKALARAMEIDPAKKDLGLWLALAKEQDGDLAGAAADYKAILKDAPPDADWRAVVEARVKELEVPKPAAGAPSQQGDVPADIKAMAEEMVSGLQARLKGNGDDPKGWLMLIRSLKVLGRDADAKAAISAASQALGTNAEAIAAVGALAKELGLADGGQ